MDRTVKAPGAGELGEWREVLGIAGVAVGVPSLVELAGLSLKVAPMWGGPEQSVPLHNPAAVAWELFSTHTLAWTPAATGGLITVVGGTLAGVAVSAVAARWACRRCRQAWAGRGWGRQRGRIQKEVIDTQARYMGRGEELAGLTRTAVAARAAGLGVRLAPDDEPGVMIGLAVGSGRALYASYEDLHLDIWGPRSGKSTSRVIPAVMDAIGAVVATSNKRDVVDATRRSRSRRGRTWVFDPQGVAEEPVGWYWDPMAWVLGTDGEGAQKRAAELAGHFASGDDGAAAKADPFFEPEGEDLLAGLFLAAALEKRPVTRAFEWVTNSNDDSPVQILRDGGFPLLAGAVLSQYNAPEKQRAGVFSTAKKMASCLKYAEIRPWVTPAGPGEKARDAFDVADFVRSRDTLYPLSKEGKGSAGPLVTALCAAVADAGEREGTRHGGRMPVPMLIVLDEAANIVRWADLPKQYSHFGSRGIVVMTILQSWAQGVRCWGPDGMTALWSAANIKVLGAGLDDAGFLRDRSELIGPHYELATSVTRGKGGERSTSTSRTSETTLHASDLAALPRGRMVVFCSGHRPTLAQAVPWMRRSYAAEIRDALAAVAAGPAVESLTPETGTRPRLRVVAVTAPEGRIA
jgi:type IV secretory pathway TraG/TraD family ATPase VirD4